MPLVSLCWLVFKRVDLAPRRLDRTLDKILQRGDTLNLISLFYKDELGPKFQHGIRDYPRSTVGIPHFHASFPLGLSVGGVFKISPQA